MIGYRRVMAETAEQHKRSDTDWIYNMRPMPDGMDMHDPSFVHPADGMGGIDLHKEIRRLKKIEVAFDSLIAANEIDIRLPGIMLTIQKGKSQNYCATVLRVSQQFVSSLVKQLCKMLGNH